MKKSDSSQPNPALKDLQILIGQWEMEISNAAFLPDRSATVKGAVSFEWVERLSGLAHGRQTIRFAERHLADPSG